MKKIAFTLAEVMITLVVIGVITAVILPVAIHSKPNENVMKFKKANNTLFQAVSTLINSDNYYKDGDFSLKPNGDSVGSTTYKTYFCETLADILSTKQVNCSSLDTGARLSHYNAFWTEDEITTITLFELDEQCIKAVENGMTAEIVTNDGVSYYQTNPAYTYSNEWCMGPSYDDMNPTSCTSGSYTYVWKLFYDDNRNEYIDTYKPFCIDVDGINNGEAPFGYGIRVDGKILLGKRAQEWLEKSIQGDN